MKNNKLPKKFLDILACPMCKSSLKYTSKKDGLVCANCNKKYQIIDGIPILIHSKK